VLGAFARSLGLRDNPTINELAAVPLLAGNSFDLVTALFDTANCPTAGYTTLSIEQVVELRLSSRCRRRAHLQIIVNPTPQIPAPDEPSLHSRSMGICLACQPPGKEPRPGGPVTRLAGLEQIVGEPSSSAPFSNLICNGSGQSHGARPRGWQSGSN
jgi:hypothetical protein